jgi:predicted component of type VI protein secretion system
MIQLRLFRSAEPFQQIDERSLDEGDLVIGRDPSAHWMIADESCELSRRHCVISLRGLGAVLRDTSSNGVFVGEERKRAPAGEEVALAPFETLHLGQFLIVVEPRPGTPANDTGVFAALFKEETRSDALNVRSDWEGEPNDAKATDPDPGPNSEAGLLLQAFCDGAGLDASSFAGEDPARVMGRAGALYKQMVLGLGDLLSERSLVKADLRIDRTSISEIANNPLKWAPTRRVAIDLLRQRPEGAPTAASALRSSFEDLKKHTLCLMAGSRASVDHVLRTLAPQLIENQVTGQSMLRLNKFESCWRAYQNAHAHLADEEPAGPQCSVNRAFKSGYEKRLRDLDESATKS